MEEGKIREVEGRARYLASRLQRADQRKTLIVSVTSIVI